ncbi:NAD(P)-binding protein [Ephemerocybe angulata]|uniref:NAD(P)-binding protein n=1 Tax=Ephemerocybe angulata TaxID=980116 RepID=A0A8H6HPT8_9AGAR|nr:NAD(P)-binding protein [Tulosesus angulatus]
MSKNITLIGGHGKVALKLARLLADENNTVYSVIRNEAQSDNVRSSGAQPIHLSLEKDSVEKFTKHFVDTQTEIGAKERTKHVDYEGALKIFDAIEGVKQHGAKNPRFVTLSAIDTRNLDIVPKHYVSCFTIISLCSLHATIGDYMHWKYEADKNLVQRKAFSWTILRSGVLSDKPGTGKASVGKTHLTPSIARDDVALALSLLGDREDAAGLAIDIVGGEMKIEKALDKFIATGEHDYYWLG